MTTLSLADFTTPNLLISALHSRTVVGVVNELNSALHLNDALPENLFLTPATVNRELLTSLTMDCGMVITQVRHSALASTRFTLGQAREPLAWRANWLKPIEFVCLIVEPAGRPNEYVEVLTTLSYLSRDADILNPLRAAATADEMLAVLRKVPLGAGHLTIR